MIVRFDSDCVTARLEGRVSVQTLDAVDRALTYQEPGAYFSPAFKLGHWDGTRKLFDRKNQEFPAGLEHRILAVLDKHTTAYTIADDRPINGYESELVDTVTLKGVDLYPEQRTALHSFFMSEARGCMELPTNFGKTEILAGVLKILKTKRALVLMDSKSLMSQTATRLRTRLEEPIGMYGAGLRKTKHRVTVATIQSMWHHLGKLKKDFFPGIDVLAVDECHRISPKTWHRVLEQIHAPVRLGLSATIKEASRRMVVESYLGPIVHESSVTDMIEAGRAAKPTIKMIRLGGLVHATEPGSIYDEGIVYNIERNRLICEAVTRCMYEGKPFLVLVVRIDHGHKLQQMLEEREIHVPFLYGDTPLDDIERAKKRFGTSSVPGIIASTIFDMGQDMPAVRVLVLGGGQRSPLRTIQRVGRSLRNKSDGDNTVEIVDFFDMQARMLQNQSDERRRTYKKKYGDVTLVGSLDDVFKNPVSTVRQPVA